MKNLTKDERITLAEKIMDWGNLSFAGLVIAQFVTSMKFNIKIAFGGIIMTVIAYIFAI